MLLFKDLSPWKYTQARRSCQLTAREQVLTSWLASKCGGRKRLCDTLVESSCQTPSAWKEQQTDWRPTNKVNSHWRRLDLIVRLSGHRSTIHPAGSHLASVTHRSHSLSQHALLPAMFCSLSLSEAFPAEVCVPVFVCVCLSLSLLRTDSSGRSWRCSLNAPQRRLTSRPTTTRAKPYRCEVVFSCLFCQQRASHSHSL